jgi:hypothetical protein
MDEGFRVEVSFDDEEHGTSLLERLRAVDLDDQARERLGPGVMVSRTAQPVRLHGERGPAQEAERVVRDLVPEDGSPPTSA